MNFQKEITKYNFALYLGLNVVCFAVIFLIFPFFHSVVFLSSWTVYFVLVFWLFVFKVPLNFVTFLIFFFIKIVKHKQAVLELYTPLLTHWNLLCFLLFGCLILLIFLFFRKTNTYEKGKQFGKDLMQDEVILSTHLKEDVVFFGAAKVHLINSFIILNGVCFCNDILAIDLLVSTCEHTRILVHIFLYVFSFNFIFVTMLEIYIIVYFNHPTNHPLSTAASRIGRLAIAGAVQAYSFDRICLSGEFDPPTSFQFVQDYQFKKLGCVATTKSSLKAITRYKDLGIQEPLPLLDNKRDLDIQRVNDRISSRELLNENLASQRRIAFQKALKDSYNASISDAGNRRRLELLAPPLE